MPIVFDYIKFNDDFSNLINKLNRNFRLLEDKQGPTGPNGNLGFIGMPAKPGIKGDIGSRGLSDRFIFQTSVNLVSNAVSYTFEEYYQLLYENLGVITKTEYDIIAALPDLPNDIPENIQSKISEFESVFVDFATREETLNVFLVSQTTSNIFQLTSILYELSSVKLTFANLGTLINTSLGSSSDSYFVEAPYDASFGVEDNVSRSLTPNKAEHGVMISNIYSPNPFTISTTSRTSNSLPISTVFDSRRWFNEVVNTYTGDTRLYEHRIISTNYKASGNYSPILALGNIEVSPIDVNAGLTTQAKELLYKSFYSIGVKEGVDAEASAYELVVMPMTYVSGIEKYISLYSSGLIVGDKTGTNKVKITTTPSTLVFNKGLTINGLTTVVGQNTLLSLQSTNAGNTLLQFRYNSSNQYFEIRTSNPVTNGILFEGSTQIPFQIKDNTVGFGIEPSALNVARITARGAILLKEDNEIPQNEAYSTTKRIGLFPSQSIVQIGQHSNWVSGANATYSFSMGSNSIATMSHSFVFGSNNTSSSLYSFVFGNNNTSSSSLYSTTIGSDLVNSCYHNHVFGRLNDNYGSSTWISTDPLFVVGNGYITGGQIQKSNAFTILKSGNIEIGSRVLTAWNSTPRVAINGKADSVFLQLHGISSNNFLRIYQNEIVFSHTATPMPPGNQFNIKNDYGAIHIVSGSSIGTGSSLMLASNGVGVGVNRNPRGKFEVYKSGKNADMLLNSDSTALKFNVDATKSVITSTVANSTSARELKLAVGTTNAISISTTGNTTVDRTFTASLESFLTRKTIIGSASTLNNSIADDMLHVTQTVASTSGGTFIRIDNPISYTAGTKAGIKFGLQVNRSTSNNPQGAIIYDGIDTTYGKGEFIFALSSRTSHTLVSADDWKAKLLNNGDFDIKGKYKKNGVIVDILGKSQHVYVVGSSGSAIFYVSAIRYDSYTLVIINASLPSGCDLSFDDTTAIDGISKFLNDNGLLPANDERISGVTGNGTATPTCYMTRFDFGTLTSGLHITVRNPSSIRENVTLSFSKRTP